MRDVESMPGRIEAWLAVHARPGKVQRYELMTGGFSRVMARVTIAWDDGGSEVLVLRGDPPPDQATLSSDRDAEWALLRGLTELGCLPVPAARWYVDDEQWFGTKALFLDHLPSTTLQAQLEAGGDPDAATTGLCQLMADVAAIGPEALPGVPCPSDWDAYIDAKLAAWRAIADEHVEALPVIRYLVAWMDAHRPPRAPFRLVHGDLQAANVLVTPEGTWHLIDWEFARIGDPREDLGYYNAYSGAVPPNLVARDVDAFLAGFRERTGLDEELVNPATFAWFTILSTLFAVKGLFDGVAAVARGERYGTPVAYNAILVTLGHRNFVDAIAGIEAGMATA
jgi:aminoglycoside phosphotransferase (APT) family kinase protein